MIRREENGQFHLIRQDDHAKLSGELAAHLGHGPFEPILAGPADLAKKALTAIAMHDCGWPLHDDAPTINARQLPTDVFESKHDVVLKVWSASADRAQAVDPYIGLLVSLHGFALSVLSLTEVMHHFSRKSVAYTRERFELNRFQHNEVERQTTLRTQLGLRTDVPLYHGVAELGLSPAEDLLIHHFRTLQSMDKLSLAMCCTKSPFESFDLAPRAGEKSHKIKMERKGSTVVLDPWVFDQDRLTVSVPAKVIPVQHFPTEAAFQAVYGSAPIETLSLSVEPGPIR